MNKKLTAREFLASGDNAAFLQAVAKANEVTPPPNPPITANVRQVRKWRRRAGLAWKAGRAR